MDFHLTGIFFVVWFTALMISAYATYHLYEYGSSNFNGIWGIFRSVTDTIYYLSFLAFSLELVSVFKGSWIDFFFAAVISFLFVFVIRESVITRITRPYRKQEQEKSEYYIQMMLDKLKLKERGLYPDMPTDPTCENYERDLANHYLQLKELRRQGLLPPIPESMQNK